MIMDKKINVIQKKMRWNIKYVVMIIIKYLEINQILTLNNP